MGLVDLLFGILSAAAFGAAFGVVFTRNTIYSALFFVSHLLCLGVLYALMQAPLLGVIQVMVYAGAVMVLFIFAIMILDISDFEDDEIGERPKALVAATALVLTFTGMFFAYTKGLTIKTALAEPAHGLQPLDTDNVVRVARVLFRDHVITFELIGILLLVAVVCVMVMAKRRLEN